MAHIKRLLGLIFTLVMVGSLVTAARADPITVSYTSGTPGTASYVNASVTITAMDDGTVTFLVANLLLSDQVWSVAQNISGLYFNVNTAGGGSLTASSAMGTWIESPKWSTPTATLTALPISPTGWALSGDGSGNFALCVICWPTNPVAGPTSTIIGGTGVGDYIHANGSLDNNTAHNPFLVSDAVFTMHIDGVTSETTFSNVTFQFGTTATPPTDVPDGSAMGLVFMSGLAVAGMLVRRRA